MFSGKHKVKVLFVLQAFEGSKSCCFVLFKYFVYVHDNFKIYCVSYNLVLVEVVDNLSIYNQIFSITSFKAISVPEYKTKGSKQIIVCGALGLHRICSMVKNNFMHFSWLILHSINITCSQLHPCVGPRNLSSSKESGNTVEWIITPLCCQT